MGNLKIPLSIKFRQFNHFVDALMVLLNISNTYSIIPFLLFTNRYGVNAIIITIINVIFIIIRFGAKIKFPYRDPLFYIYILISVLNFVFSSITNTIIFGFIPFITACVTFYIILFNIYQTYLRKYSFSDSIILINRGYLWLCTYVLFIALLFLVLIEVFKFNPLINQIDSKKFDFLEDNIMRTKAEYYYPYNISLILKSSQERLPFFHKYGTITTIFHEPHTMAFVVFPSLFLMLLNLKRKWTKGLVISIFIIFSLVAASAMNIMSLFAVTLIAFSTKYKKFALVILVIFIYGGLKLITVENPVIDFIRNKLVSGSSAYSISTLQFAFSPKTFIGTNILDTSYAKYGGSIGQSLNVGYVIFSLNIIFLSILIYKIAYLLFSKNKDAWYIGLFASYFLIHSTKLALSTYSLSLLLFVIFLVSAYYSELKTNNKIIKDIEST